MYQVGYLFLYSSHLSNFYWKMCFDLTGITQHMTEFKYHRRWIKKRYYPPPEAGHNKNLRITRTCCWNSSRKILWFWYRSLTVRIAMFILGTIDSWIRNKKLSFLLNCFDYRFLFFQYYHLQNDGNLQQQVQANLESFRCILESW